MNSSASSQLLQDNRLHNSSTPQPEKMNPDSFGAWLSTDVMRWTYAIIKLGCLIARSVRNNYVGVTLSRDTGHGDTGCLTGICDAGQINI